TPFGHLGEQALTPFLDTPFRHNEESLRIVDHLENDGRGLNLTWEVRDGILHHPWSMPEPSTPEGRVVRLADRIAYVNHDVDDAVRAGVVAEDELPRLALDVLGRTHGERINTLVTDLVEHSDDSSQIRLSEDVSRALDVFRDFMFERVYLRDEARAEQDKAIALVRTLFAYYLDHPDTVPAEYHQAPGDLPTRIADYIAGMTDRYALRVYEQLFLPQGWLL
ncbi:MAG TPA: deoxyguanosinetriphosphate triphosphohydrolase, partial [Actinomycetota bacterium]|nr:deoxyguanosinetriphosphate triphosphohydrolase [Actinomycetota bacterium]